MQKRDELQGLFHSSDGPYAFQLVEGMPAVHRHNVVTQEEIGVGDKVTLFYLPGGKYFISKVPADLGAFTVGKLTLTHIYFDDEITVEEK